MEKEHHPNQKDLDILKSKLNALEVSATDNFQKSLIEVLRVLVENQLHSLTDDKFGDRPYCCIVRSYSRLVLSS